jgi:hypothetical protein
MVAKPYHCHKCGKLHYDLPHIGADKPDNWWDVAEEERERRIELTSDTCIIDGEHFFIRGVIQIPVHGQREPFGFNVWVSQKKENFETYLANFDSREIGPFFGWLCTWIAFYAESTMTLKSRALFRGGGLRPLIEVAPTDHPLSIDQRKGITLAKAWEIVHFYMKE